VVSPGTGARGHKTTRKLFVSYIMTRNNTTNNVHVAATEPRQLLSQNIYYFNLFNTNTEVFGEETAQKPLSGCAALK